MLVGTSALHLTFSPTGILALCPGDIWHSCVVQPPAAGPVQAQAVHRQPVPECQFADVKGDQVIGARAGVIARQGAPLTRPITGRAQASGHVAARSALPPDPRPCMHSCPPDPHPYMYGCPGVPSQGAG